MTPAEREATVLTETERFLRRHARGAEQAALLVRALAGVRARREQAASATYYLGCVHLPLLVYAAVNGEAAPALPLAVATTLLHAGLDLFDDVMDGDLAPAWQARRPAEVVLTAATLLCALPQLALAELPAAPATIVALQATLARAGLELSDGQQRDVALARRGDVSVAAVQAAIDGKSGAELALYAALAARLAGASEQAIARYTACGRALGAARQVRSDCRDLLSPRGRDLANGTRTLPIALLLEQCDDPAALLSLLAGAEGDEQARAAVRAQALAAGVLRECALTVESHCQQAHGALMAAAAREPAAAALRALIDECSFFVQHAVQNTANRGVESWDRI